MKLLTNKEYLALTSKIEELQNQLKDYQFLQDSRVDFERALNIPDIKNLSGIPIGVLSSLINTMKSSKNILLLSQKRVRTADEIAMRDGAILFADMIIRKLELNFVKNEKSS